MNHRIKLLDLYKKACSLKYVNLPQKINEYTKLISKKSIVQKGVFTVLITLAIHKILYPKQDIRLHQEKMKGGFSGRTIDTKYITPTLKELCLPSMAESGWLTRSLEQPFPYTLDYKGNIRDVEVKEAFLNLVDFIQKEPRDTENLVMSLLYYV
ncbi:MAG: hypothetical protein LUH11_01785, partial [Candidatus Gastranaerophilales bacterium]|nr:hypothetical protein [Candidatus Gastranaerophilales bacterium]